MQTPYLSTRFEQRVCNNTFGSYECVELTTTTTTSTTTTTTTTERPFIDWCPNDQKSCVKCAKDKMQVCFPSSSVGNRQSLMRWFPLVSNWPILVFEKRLRQTECSQDVPDCVKTSGRRFNVLSCRLSIREIYTQIMRH